MKRLSSPPLLSSSSSSSTEAQQNSSNNRIKRKQSTGVIVGMRAALKSDLKLLHRSANGKIEFIAIFIISDIVVAFLLKIFMYGEVQKISPTQGHRV